jgi:hypothetical protein
MPNMIRAGVEFEATTETLLAVAQLTGAMHTAMRAADAAESEDVAILLGRPIVREAHGVLRAFCEAMVEGLNAVREAREASDARA